MSSPIEFRNIARYVDSVEGNLPLYEAIGFEVVQKMGTDMAVMKNAEGVKLVLHKWTEHTGRLLDTAIGFTVAGTLEEARAFVEAAGWRLKRAPDTSDAGYFHIYQDLDGNPINLVGRGKKTAE